MLPHLARMLVDASSLHFLRPKLKGERQNMTEREVLVKEEQMIGRL